jgi:hypothetical protein
MSTDTAFIRCTNWRCSRSERYNGWTNRETWLVGVWDFFDYDEVKQAIIDIVGRPLHSEADIAKISGWERAVTLALAEWLEIQHEDTLHEVMDFDKLPGYLQDHLNTSIGAINWLEIAEHYRNEIKDALKESEVRA